MKKITFLSILWMLLTIPIAMGQTSFKNSTGTIASHGNTSINGSAGSASILIGNMAPIIITQSTSQNIEPLNSASCPSGDDSFFRDFDLASEGITNDFEVSSVEFGIEETSVSMTVTVNIYSMAPGSFPASYPSGATLQGSASVAITAANNMSIVSLPLTATIPAGENLIYELFAPDTTSGGNFYPGSNSDGQSGISYIQSAPCGAASPLDVSGLGFPDMHLVFNVLGEEATGGGGITYCTASGNSSTFENITNVTYAGIDNTTTTHSGYNDFTAQVAHVNQGGTDQLSVTINADSNDYLYAFIDWDQNGVLDDAGEVYTLAGPTSSDGPHTMNIAVPAGASLGDTRMRIKLGWNQSTPDPCGTFSFGEVEDYTVNVQGPIVGNAPIIACPTDIVANNASGTCGAVANFAGVAFDVEDGDITGDIIATPASGSTFDVGDTTVELSVTDSDGNTVTCNFTVTVIDNEDPVAVCQDLTVDLDPVTGTVTIAGADVDNGSTDNCGIASMSLDVSTFDCSMIGENTVELTVTDNSGNTSTCTTTVTVQDVTAPEIVCVGGFGSFTESEDFEGASVPAGWSTNIVVGNADWTFGSGVMPIGADFPTNAAIFDDNAAGSGQINVVELLSPVYDLSGANLADISFDYAIQDYIGAGLLRAEVWDGSAWQEVFLADDEDVPPTNTGAIDVLAYANADFQVKFTYDDEEDWGWGAGVDNFLLTYEAASGGGLDVYLDADGMASVDPMDLLLSVNESCGYTVTAGGAGGGSTGSLTTLFASNNGGSAGWAVMYDLTVGPNDIEITDLDINTDATTAFNLDLYTLAGTYVGSESDASAWGAPVTTGTGTGAGIDNPSNAVLADPVVLSANTTYGIAVVMDVKPKYTNGTGCPGNQCYDNDDISLSLGTAVAGLFTGSVFPDRVWNGTINYNVTNGSGGLNFTCADLGENMVEVTVTDDSGNASTCMAIVNVIDNIAPIITCAGNPGPISVVEDFEGSSIPSGWTTDIETGTHDWTFGSGNMPTGGDFTTNAAIFDDNEAGSGEVNKATLISPVYDLTGSTTTSISFDYAMQEYIGDGTLTVDVYDGAAWQEILFVDVDTDPINTGDLDMAAYVNADFQVRFTFDDEGNWGWGAGIDNFTVNYEITEITPIDIALGPDGTTDIDPYDLIQDVEEACGLSSVAVDVPTVTCADIGTPITVTVFASDASGNIASCTAVINVIDNLAPELTCPADQTVDPGPGNLFYIVPDYFATGEATAIDNCTDPLTDTTQDPAPGAALPDGTHTITLTATDEYGNTSTCGFELTVDTVVGVADNSLDKGVALYPNPAKHVVNLVNKTNISLEKMMIYDINGRLVNQTDLRTMQGEKAVDVSSLASGVYVVQIIGDNASTVKRLIKE